MSFIFQQPAIEPHDVDQYAKVSRDELRRGRFRHRRHAKHAGLIVLFSFAFFVAAFFVIAAVCDPGDEQLPGPAPFGQAAVGVDV